MQQPKCNLFGSGNGVFSMIVPFQSFDKIDIAVQADLRVAESTEALTRALFCGGAGRAGEAAAVICPFMEERAASRRLLSASSPWISESLACNVRCICA